MTPIAYTQEGNLVRFRYNTAELKEWLMRGRRDGNVGTLLLTIDYTPGGFTTSAVFGTIENPHRIRKTFRMKHWDVFGKQQTPEEILHPKSFDELYPHFGWVIPIKKGKLRWVVSKKKKK